MTYGPYDAAGVLKQRTDANGTVFQYGHDGNDRVTSITAGGQTTTFTYEPGSDNLKTMSAGGVNTVFDWDAAARPWKRIDQVDGKTFQTVYEYYTTDDLWRITYPSDRRVLFDWDAESRLTHVYSDTGTTYASGFAYHPSGGVHSYTAGNGLVTTIDYHPQRYWVSGIEVGPPALQFDLGYQYFPVGNIQRITDVRAGMTQEFSFDNLDRLASVSSAGYPSATFSFDAHGNRQAAGWVYDVNNRFRLKGISGLGELAYDNNGNLTAVGGLVTHQFTPDNRLAQSTVGSTIASFGYDADGWRVKKAVSGGATTYAVRGPTGQLLTEWINTSPEATVRDYIYANGRLIAVVARPATPK